MKPDEWTIGNLFEEFYDELHNLNSEIKELDFSTYYDKKEKLKNLYTQAIHLLYTNERLSFSDLMTVSIFCHIVNQGTINSYDGCGNWIDWNGNIISSISWSKEEPPEDAVFVAWYNK